MSVFYLHLHEFPDDLGLCLHTFNLCSVGVLEGIRSKVQSRSLCHKVNNDLDESLLFKSVTCMFKTFVVGDAQLKLGSLILLFTLDDLFDDAHPVNAWQGVLHLLILERLGLIDVVGNDFQHFLLDDSHVSESCIIHHVKAIVITDKE